MNRPQKFGRYLLIDRISTGGMAAVFLAKVSGAMGFQKVLAIKRILPTISEDEDFITMFIDEAKISASLAHSNIGQVFEFGQVSGQYYIAMEYIPGKDLRTIQKHLAEDGRTMEVPLALHLVSRLCQGLDYAHRQRDPEGNSMCIVHRDVSPPNIIVSYDGGVKLIDFGIAKAASRATRTRTGRLKGKFAYMAPEQVQGQEVDQRADVFSVGILLHELLTNQRLFLGPNQVATMNLVRRAEVDPPSSINPEVPPEIDRIVLKALVRDKEKRYTWCTELRADIERFIARSGNVLETHQLSSWMKGEFALDVDNERKLQERIDTLQMEDADGDAITSEEKLSRPDPNLPRIFAKNPNWDGTAHEEATPEQASAGGAEPEDDSPSDERAEEREENEGSEENPPLALMPEDLSKELELQWEERGTGGQEAHAEQGAQELEGLEEEPGTEDETLVNVPSFVEVSEEEAGPADAGESEDLPGESTDRNEVAATAADEEATEPGVDRAPQDPRQRRPTPEVLFPAEEQPGGSEGATIPLRKRPAGLEAALSGEDPSAGDPSVQGSLFPGGPTPVDQLTPGQRPLLGPSLATPWPRAVPQPVEVPPLPAPVLPLPSPVKFGSEDAEAGDLSEQAKTNPRASSTDSRELEPPEEPLFHEPSLLEPSSGGAISPGEERIGEIVGGALEIDSNPDHHAPEVDPAAPVDLRGMGEFEVDQAPARPSRPPAPSHRTARQATIPRQKGHFSSTQLKAIAAGVTLLIGSLVLLVSYLIKAPAEDLTDKGNTGTIIVTTKPPAVCSVSIGGTPKGVLKPGTPFSLSGISAGRYQIALECVGYRPTATFVDVEHAQVSFVEGILKKK